MLKSFTFKGLQDDGRSGQAGYHFLHVHWHILIGSTMEELVCSGTVRICSKGSRSKREPPGIESGDAMLEIAVTLGAPEIKNAQLRCSFCLRWIPKPPSSFFEHFQATAPSLLSAPAGL